MRTPRLKAAVSAAIITVASGITVFGSTTAAAAADPECLSTETVVTTVTNRPDGGFNGVQWALLNFTRTVEICEVAVVDEEEGLSTYSAEVTDAGTFVTEGGPANSPQENDPLADGVPGTFSGSYFAGFTAASGFETFTAMTGTKDGAPNGADNPSTGNWVKSMFSDFDGTSLFPNSWQWVYNTCVEKWVNGADDIGGSFGDIVGKPCPTRSPTPPPSNGLPPTGLEVTTYALAGTVLVGLGAIMLLVAGRRRRSTTTG